MAVFHSRANPNSKLKLIIFTIESIQLGRSSFSILVGKMSSSHDLVFIEWIKLIVSAFVGV